MKLNLSQPFIRLPVMTSLLMVAVVFFGITAYFQLPVSALPDISYPTVQVTVNYPGASAEKMANLIAGPLERQFMANVTDVAIMTSTNTYSNTTIIIQFDLSKNIALGMQQIQQAINQAQNQLPADLPQLPSYQNVNPSQTPIMYVCMSSPTQTQAELYKWCYTFLGQRLSMAQGVAQVSYFGQPHAVRAFVDPQALAAKEIGINQVSNFLSNANPNLPVGNFYGKNKEFTIISEEQMIHAVGNNYNDLVVLYQDGQPVFFKDIGYVKDGIQNDKQFFKIIFPRGIFEVTALGIQRQLQANTISTADNILKIIDQYKSELPGNMDLVIPYNQAVFIQESVNEVEFTLIIAFLLVVIIIYVFLGRIRNTVIPAISLPLTILGTFAVMALAGFNLDILSLLALTLSIGFLIDDAIIVVENIVRHVQMGKTPYQGALDGAKQISFTVLSTSVSLCAVFIPMMFMGGVIGKLFHEFAFVIIIAVLFSAVISLSLTAMLCSRFVPPYKKDEEPPFMERFSDKMNHWLVTKYDKGLQKALKHRLFVISIGIGSIVLSLVLFLKLPTTFLPMDDLSIVQLFFQSVEGTSPAAMKQYQLQLAEYFKNDPAIESVVLVMPYQNDNQGLGWVNLKEPSKRASMRQILMRYYMDLNKIPGLMAFPKAYPLINLQIGDTQSGKSDYQYTLKSFTTTDLYPTANLLVEKMQASPYFTQVSSNLLDNMPWVRVKVLRDQAAVYQLSVEDIQNALQLAFGQVYTGRLYAPENQYYIVFQVEDRFMVDSSDLSYLYIKSSMSGELIPLLSVIDFEQVGGALQVTHTDGLPSVTLSFNIAPGQPLGPALQVLEQIAAEVVPESVIAEIEGTANIFKEAFSSLWFLLIIAIFTIYIILGVLYEDFILPVTVLSTLPPASLGALIALILFRMPLSLYGFVGIIMLLGIVLKNGIMMIDFANESMANDPKLTPAEAIHNACLLRFRPILMTTFSTIFGALPIALGLGGIMAQGRQPLGVAIIGGLCLSQLMTLFITPVTFVYMCRLGNWAQRKFTIFRKNPDAAHVEHTEA